MKRIFRVWSFLVLAIAAGFLVFTSPAMSSTIIDFGIVVGTGSDLGSVSYNGVSGVLSGVGIEVDEVTYNSNPSTPLTNGLLNFDFTGGTYDSLSSTWSFAGGTIDVTGDLGTKTGLTLLTGSVYSATVVGFGNLEIVVGGFTDSKSALLLWELGYLTGNQPSPTELVNGWTGTLNLSILTGGVDPNGSFSSTKVLSGDVVNTPVPIPPSALLLGSGVLGMIGFGFRRKSRKA